jgi:hypothetical protein
MSALRGHTIATPSSCCGENIFTNDETDGQAKLSWTPQVFITIVSLHFYTFPFWYLLFLLYINVCTS